MPAREVVEVVIIGRNQAVGAFKAVTTSLGVMGTAIGALTIGLVAVAAGVVALGVAGTKTAISVESAFTGIMKTTDGLGDSFLELTSVGEEILDQYRQMAKEIPLTLEELMGIGELAGQLGVPKEALTEFTETIAALGVATNITTEQAALDLARMANIFNISAEDITENVSRMGATIVALGNTTETSEKEIVSFGMRLASMGKVAGFTQAEILSIGAAMSAVGQPAERGGTAVNKVMQKMSEAVALTGDKLELFAKTAGMSAAEFSEVWRTKPAKAFVGFVKGIGDAGEGAFAILDELALKDRRLIEAFLALAGAGDELALTLGRGDAAWDENVAHIEEAARRYATTEATWTIIKNQFRDIALEIGLHTLPALKSLLDKAGPWIEEFSAMVVGLLDGVETAFSQSSKWKDVFASIEDGAKKASESLANLVEGALNDFNMWFEENGPEIEKVTTDLGDTFANEFVPMVTQAFDTVTNLLGGFVTVFLLLTQLILELVTFQWGDAWDTFVEIVDEATATVWETLMGFFETILQGFGSSGEELKEIWVGTFLAMADYIVIFIDIIGELFVRLGVVILESLTSNFPTIFGAAQDLMNTLANIFNVDLGPSVSIPSMPPGAPRPRSGGRGRLISPHARGATGLSGIVPPGFPNDSFLIGATSGEGLLIAPGGFGSGGGGSSRAGNQRPIVIQAVYAPTFSTGNKDEIMAALKPLVEGINRELAGVL